MLRIEPSKGWVSLGLLELWQYRELLYFLSLRDFKARYKQTVVGPAWIFVKPIALMVIFSVVFGKLANLPSEGLPYPIFVYAAILPWTLFAGATAQSTSSLVRGTALIQKVYFPRLLIPVASTLTVLLDFVVAFVVMIGLMLYYGVPPTLAILTLPLFVLLALGLGLAIGLALSSLNALYRDVAQGLGFLTQAWMYASPVAYTADLVPERWQTVYALNPMVGVIEGFRWALVGTDQGPGFPLVVSIVFTLVLLVIGALFFRRMEKAFADLI